jgi:nicotinate-nucleotide adenylyltransferase
MKKTVFFGGTFNPPHIAHLEMLKSAENLNAVGKILVVPTNIPPHKSISDYTASGIHRLNMCKLLCDGVSKTEVSDMELKRDGKSYSYDTLSILKHTEQNLSILIGGDMITSFFTWYRYKEILEMVEILAVRRVGIDNDEFDLAVNRLRNEGGVVTVIDTVVTDVSSTELRQAAVSGDSETLQRLLPKNIFGYIKSNGLYKGK